MIKPIDIFVNWLIFYYLLNGSVTTGTAVGTTVVTGETGTIGAGTFGAITASTFLNFAKNNLTDCNFVNPNPPSATTTKPNTNNNIVVSLLMSNYLCKMVDM
jgi:hypothetical protein